MADTGTACRAGETPVSDQRYLVSQSHAHDIGRGSQHLLHARPSPWPFVANHHDITRLDLSIQNTGAGLFLRIVDTCRTCVPMHASNNGTHLHYCPIGSEIAEKYRKTSALAIRPVKSMDDLI